MIKKHAPNAKFMHCLPASRGMEVTDEVLEAPYSVAFDEAGNRLTAMRGLLAYFVAPSKKDEKAAQAKNELEDLL
jgi:putrescine carbamoyltransferase